MSFNPEDIEVFSVIRCPILLDGVIETKRFVVIAHKGGYFFVVKTTSQMERYDADPAQAAGVVIYEVGTTPCFESRTAIQPDNQFPISYKDLITYHKNGELEILGVLPPDFRNKLLQAIENSTTIERRKKDRLKSVL